jgi:hypothetical protein
MTPRTASAVIVCFLLLAATSFGELKAGFGRDEIRDVRKELEGTVWKGAPNAPLRPGLGGLLMFTDKTVESAGYRYEAKSRDTFTLFFNHGDKQEFRLAPDGKHLKFSFKNKNYAYDLISTGGPLGSEFRVKLAGTTWQALPNKPLRPGLVQSLAFTERTVGPAAYLYYVNNTENLTLYFDYGDAQPMVLSPDGKRLSFVWKGGSYVYEIAGQ